jgi:hypothetical protein
MKQGKRQRRRQRVFPILPKPKRRVKRRKTVQRAALFLTHETVQSTAPFTEVKVTA